MKKSIFLSLFLLVFIALEASAQKNAKLETIEIKTSAVCNMCKSSLETDLKYEKGVKTVKLDVLTKVLTVSYNPKKTNPDKIRKAVTKVGYDADSLPADPKAYEQLEDCCKKENPTH
ncbi:MAG: heavy-metal-associated domain-containing protein [Thermonemataceae bacterium]|nr:heavy-metal-associated domain-containing protein [Thermonemataceae bacterium]